LFAPAGVVEKPEKKKVVEKPEELQLEPQP
jgi:hypothetical protein